MMKEMGPIFKGQVGRKAILNVHVLIPFTPKVAVREDLYLNFTDCNSKAKDE